MEHLQMIINNALYLSLLLIIVSSVISVFFIGRKRDRCLRDFHRFLGYVYLKNGKIVFGVIRVYGTGIEFCYRNNHHDKKGHIESSFILYSWEYPEMVYIKRFHRELIPQNRKKRMKDIRKVHHPSIFRISRRKLRNFLSTFQDGITRSLSTVINTMATRNPKSRLSQQQKDLTGIGTQVVNVACHSYDPIIESYIGHFVVLELPENGVIREYCGILKEYTQNFIEILNVLEIESVHYAVMPNEYIDNSWLHLEWNHQQICIENSSDWPVFIQSATVADAVLLKDFLLAEKTCFRQEPRTEHLFDEQAALPLVLDILVPNIYDMVVPRSLALIRHGCPRDKHTLETFIGSSGSKMLTEALHKQFVLRVNVQKLANQEETAHPN